MAQGLIPSIVVQVIATVSGVIISVGVPLILAKLNKISKVHTTLFGVDDVDSMGGLVAVVESNTEKIEGVEETAEEALDEVEAVDEKVEELQQMCQNRDNWNKE